MRERLRLLEARRSGARGMERVRLDHDAAVIREMIRDARRAIRDGAASGERRVRRLSRDAGAGQALRLDFAAAGAQAEGTGELEWLRRVVADGMVFCSAELRDMLRMYYCGEATMEEVGRAFGLSRTAVSRRLSRARRRLRQYAADRLRLRRELLGETVDGAALMAELGCLSPRQRQVLGLFFQGERNRDIARELGVQPCTVSHTRRRGADKLEVLGGDVEELGRRSRHGERALLGGWRIERRGDSAAGKGCGKGAADLY